MDKNPEGWRAKWGKVSHWFLDALLGHVVTIPAVNLLVTAALTLVAWSFGWGTTLLKYISIHPGRITISLVVLGVVLVVGARLNEVLKTYVRNREIISAVGLNAFWPHTTSGQKASDWKGCQALIEEAPPDNLRILGVTGWDTFGSEKAPLHDLVQNFKGEIRILLIMPGCDAFKMRALALGINETDYEQDVRKTLDVCSALKAKGKSISVKLYKQTPIWKMIFTNNYLWLQYYKPDAHVDNTPVYTFFANKSGTSLYFPLVDVFRKRWERDGNKQVV